MGRKKNRGKKPESSGKNAAPKVSQNLLDVTSKSKADNSMELTCNYCDSLNATNEWLVQCDKCDCYVHFRCAGITTIGEEDPWQCRDCTTNIESNQILVTADVHNPPTETLDVTQTNDPKTKQKDQRSEVRIEDLSENGSVIATGQSHEPPTLRKQVQPSKAKSKSSRVPTISSAASSRKQDLELQRIEEELKLQETVDEDTLAVKLEAIKLRKIRQEKYLKDKYTALSAGEGSVISRKSNVTQKASYVSSWIEEQRKLVKKTKTKSLDENFMRNINRFHTEIDEINFDVSIPVEPHEIQKLRNERSSNPSRVPEETLREKQSRIHREGLESYKRQLNAATITSKPHDLPVQNIQHPEVLSQGKATTRVDFQSISHIHRSENSSSKSHSNQDQRFHEGQRKVIENQKIQQSNILSSQATSQFKMPPRSRSTLVNERTTSVNQYSFDVQQPNTYIFQRSSQPTTTQVTYSGYVNQRTEHPDIPQYEQVISNQSTVKQDPVNQTFNGSSQPTSKQVTCFGYSNLSNDVSIPVRSSETVNPVTSVATSGPNYCENENFRQRTESPDIQYYDQVFSNQNPVNPNPVNQNPVNHVNLSMGQGNRIDFMDQPIFPVNLNPNPVNQNAVNHVNSSPQRNRIGFMDQPIQPRTSSNAENIMPQEATRTLTASQIASRHAIPKDLPHFSGNPKEWCRFLMRYVNSTNMCGFTNEENLERLAKCLKGKAYTLVESLLLMPNSVPDIMDTLYDRYGRPELVVNVVLNEVRRYPVMRPDKLELLSDYGYAVRNACNLIEGLQLRNHLYNPELIQEIVEKLPFQTRIEWSRFSLDLPQVTLREIADWLYSLFRTINRILSLEKTTRSNDQWYTGKTEKNSETYEDTSNEDSENYLNQKRSKTGFVYVHDKDKSSFSNSKKKCVICSKECETLEVCSKFNGMDVNQRWKSLINNELCRKCLKFHDRNCDTAKVCGVNGCEFIHHYLLHNPKKRSKHSAPTEDNGSLDHLKDDINWGENVGASNSNPNQASTVEDASARSKGDSSRK